MAISVRIPVDLDYFQAQEMPPEQVLAIAVIGQAFTDIERYFRAPGKPSKWNVSQAEASEAAHFLLGDTGVLGTYMEMAGLHLNVGAVAHRRFPRLSELL